MKKTILTTITTIALLSSLASADDCGYIDNLIREMKQELVKIEIDEFRRIELLKLIKKTEQEVKECNESVRGVE